MDRRVAIAIGILAAAAFGYWFFKRKQSTTTGVNGAPPAPAGLEDQGPAQAAMANYTVPPNVGMQMNQPSQTFVNNAQAMPLPYNT